MKIYLIFIILFLSVVAIAQTTADKITVINTAGSNDPPQNFSSEARFHVKHNPTIGLANTPANYSGVMTFSPWSDDSAGPTHQLAFNSSGIYWRQGLRPSTWNIWRKIISEDPTNGYVGIGTTTPGTALSVASDSEDQLHLSRKTGAAGDNIFLAFSHSNNTNSSNVRARIGVNILAGGAGRLVFQTGPVGAILERMRIDEAGNVGIGTTNPGMKLHLGTSNSLEGLGLSHSNGAWTNFFSPSMTGGAYNGITQPGDTGLIFGNAAGINTVSNGFVIAPHRSTVSGLRISNNGDVGIGTSYPDAKLSVKGQIHAQEVKVDLNGAVAPDYVFEPTYNLSPLDSIKTYIDKNKHLPEVPSAKEIEKNGVNLGEMNMLLLKKIEELTLYQIEMNGKMEAVMKENSELKNRVEKIENRK